MFSLLLCAYATIVALEKLYSRWTTDPLFDYYQLGHMFEKVENPCFARIKDTTSFDSKFNKSLCRSRMSGNLI